MARYMAHHHQTHHLLRSVTSSRCSPHALWPCVHTHVQISTMYPTKQCMTTFKDVAIGSTEVWSGPLAGGDMVVALLNQGTTNETITANWSDLGLAPTQAAQVRDLWQHKDLGKRR